MTEPQQDNVFIPQPLSIHRMSEDEFRRHYKRSAIGGMAWFTLLLPGSYVIIHFARGTAGGSSLWIGLSVFVPALVISLLLSYWIGFRRQLRICHGTTIELWPDSLIYRIDGRPPLVLRREEIESLQLRPAARVLFVKSSKGIERSLLIATGINDFDKLHEALSCWCPESPQSNPWLRLRLHQAILSALSVGSVLGVCYSSDLRLVTPAAMVIILVTAWHVVVILRASHLPKRTRHKVWLSVTLCVVLVAVAALKWFKWLVGMSLWEVMKH